MDEAGTTNTTDGAFVKISLNRSDVAELLRRSLLPDTDANIDAALGSRSDVEVVPIEFIDDLIRGGVQYWASTPGVFAAEEHSGFTVVDNNTGDCFTETFATLTGALAYIDGAEAEDAHRIDLAPLPLDLITFGDEISECEDRLNFYIPVTFDCDAVFGTNVCSIDNDDWLNIYVDYDMARGEVADHLEISLNRADGEIEYLTYPLDAMQRRALLTRLRIRPWQNPRQSAPSPKWMRPTPIS